MAFYSTMLQTQVVNSSINNHNNEEYPRIILTGYSRKTLIVDVGSLKFELSNVNN
jgi:hypothetical protein